MMDNRFSIGFFVALQFLWWDFLDSPLKGYRKAKIWRDKILATVEYLQTESAKWKALFTTLKAPYSLLRAMGFSPQFAGSLLAAGSIAVSYTHLTLPTKRIV